MQPHQISSRHRGTVQCGALGHLQEGYQRPETGSRQSLTHEHHCIWGHLISFVGTVLLWVWWEDFNCSVDCKLVGRQDTCQLLGRNARQGMRTVSYLDNNHLNKPQTGGAPVYAAEELGLLTMQEITKTFSTVFEGVCWLSACAISHDTLPPVQHVPRQV